MLHDKSTHSFRLIDWDVPVTVASAAGMDSVYSRDGRLGCALDQPAVPVPIWGEAFAHGLPHPTIAPETLFSWRDGARHGCKFSPAVDIWHAGLLLAHRVLRCDLKKFKPNHLLNGTDDGGGLVAAYVNLFGTAGLYSIVDKYGWKLDRPCTEVCETPPGPLKFTKELLSQCQVACGSTGFVEGELISRRLHQRPMPLSEWCSVLQGTPSGEALKAADLVSRMLVWDPAQRITAAIALHHPFLTRATRDKLH